MNADQLHPDYIRSARTLTAVPRRMMIHRMMTSLRSALYSDGRHCDGPVAIFDYRWDRHVINGTITKYRPIDISIVSVFTDRVLAAHYLSAVWLQKTASTSPVDGGESEILLRGADAVRRQSNLGRRTLKSENQFRGFYYICKTSVFLVDLTAYFKHREIQLVPLFKTSHRVEEISTGSQHGREITLNRHFKFKCVLVILWL